MAKKFFHQAEVLISILKRKLNFGNFDSIIERINLKLNYHFLPKNRKMIKGSHLLTYTETKRNGVSWPILKVSRKPYKLIIKIKLQNKLIFPEIGLINNHHKRLKYFEKKEDKIFKKINKITSHDQKKEKYKQV